MFKCGNLIFLTIVILIFYKTFKVFINLIMIKNIWLKCLECSNAMSSKIDLVNTNIDQLLSKEEPLNIFTDFKQIGCGSFGAVYYVSIKFF